MFITSRKDSKMMMHELKNKKLQGVDLTLPRTNTRSIVIGAKECHAAHRSWRYDS
jgi:hypothetical protein